MGAGHFNRKFIKSSLKPTIGKECRNNFKKMSMSLCIYESTTDNSGAKPVVSIRTLHMCTDGTRLPVKQCQDITGRLQIPQVKSKIMMHMLVD